MKIPKSSIKATENFVIDALKVCMESLPDRRLLYERRRRWFLYGQEAEERVEFNRIQNHIELVKSFLFSPDMLKWSVARASEEGSTPLDHEVKEKLADHLRDEAAPARLIKQFSECVKWALVYDSMFLKMGWSDSRKQVGARIVDGYNFCVYDETEPDLDDQDAFAHIFFLPPYEAIELLERAGKKDRIKDLQFGPRQKQDERSPVERSLLISQTGGSNLAGSIVGAAKWDNVAPNDYRGNMPPDYVPFRELWIWDSESGDYRTFLLAGDDIVVQDSKDKIDALKAIGGKYVDYGSATNSYLPGEHPFVQIMPYELYDYFWGESHCERLIPLQMKTNERLEDKDETVRRLLRSAKAFIGFGGLSYEKATAFGGPDTYVMEPTPGATIEEFKPDIQLLEKLMDEEEKLGDRYLEASGLTKTVTGEGTAGVRSKEHARQLATTGSGRIKDTALSLEPPLSRMGELELKLIVHNDVSRLKLPSGPQFIPAQADADWNVSVDGHSHSPLFADKTEEIAEKLFKASAIDKESLIKLMNPPGVAALVERLRKMEQKQAQQQAGQANLTKAEDEAKRSHHKQPAKPSA